MPNIPFSPPRIDQKIIDEVVDTLKSGWITTGPKVKRFEEELTRYGGHKSTLCVNSGSGGLELMLRWFGIGKGDEVIVPAYTYTATANVVVHCGAKVVFVDVDADFNIRLDEIKKAITDKTKVIIPVDLAGFPCDYEAINNLVASSAIKQYFTPTTEVQKKLGRILILSDAAHSVGAVYKGHHTGSLTDLTVYSFHAVKNLTTAEGGAVCLNLPAPFNNSVLYQELKIKALHGQSKDAFSKLKPGAWKYDVTEPGYKLNMTDIAAAMGLVELARYDDDMLKRRKEIFRLYTSAFSKYEWAQLPTFETKEKRSSFHVFLLRIRDISEEQRDQIIHHISETGVSVNVHFIPIPMLSFYRNLGYDIDKYPVSRDNFNRVISLPVYYDLTDNQVSIVIDTVIAAVERVLET
ncbi:MAG: DegT/DnrJ/EryC1/StrS aminotransferase family protein [Bacteroidales bacterium]|nr:DegT/DnrJ/EryC1/StrS aminotransferase family protein [Bacteroidales bacterium]